MIVLCCGNERKIQLQLFAVITFEAQANRECTDCVVS